MIALKHCDAWRMMKHRLYDMLVFPIKACIVVLSEFKCYNLFKSHNYITLPLYAVYSSN